MNNKKIKSAAELYGLYYLMVSDLWGKMSAIRMAMLSNDEGKFREIAEDYVRLDTDIKFIYDNREAEADKLNPVIKGLHKILVDSLVLEDPRWDQ